jgi:hypothetical protein
MGIRDGKFRCVPQSSFLNAAYRFFFDLYVKSHRSVEPEWEPSNFEKKNAFRFNGIIKWAVRTDLERRVYDEFSFKGAPFGSPLPKAYWAGDKPEWSYNILNPKEEDLIGEEIAPPIYYKLFFEKFLLRSGEFLWEKQRYKLIEKMRFCTIPLDVQYRYRGETRWWPYRTKHYINANLSWELEHRYKITVPPYWCANGIDYKIGIFAKKRSSSDTQVALDGCYWLKAPSFETNIIQNNVAGSSEVRIYGAVDLATHQDFAKYFDSSDYES